MKKEINERCPLQGECGRKKCEHKFCERDCGYYQGNARPGAEIPDQARAMEAEWEAKMSDISVLADASATAAPQEADPVVVQENTGSLVLLPVDRLRPHPDNPRKDLGDIQELADSIKVNGVLQNLTVVSLKSVSEEWSALEKQYQEHPTEELRTRMNRIAARQPHDGEGLYRVIIGHRRLAAAKLAGLTEVPCVVTMMTDKEQLQTMLMENMQRTDLTIYEQAQGFQLMLDLGSTVDEIAEKSGFSKTTVRRRVKLLDLDADKFKKSEARGATIQDYLELDKIESIELKNKVLDAIGTANFRDVLKRTIEDEKHLRRMAQWETDLEAFALKIEKRDYVGDASVRMDYVRNYGRWSPKDTTVERPMDAGEVKYYYLVSANEIDLYKDWQERVETEEERQRKVRKQIADQIKARLQETTKRHFSLRSEFVSGFSASKKHLLEICKYAADILVGDGEWVRDEINTELAGKLLNLNIDDNTDYPTFKAMVEQQIAADPEHTLLVCAYASADEDENGYWDWEWNSQICTYEYKHKSNEGLDQLYEFLIALGYTMSDEEKMMRDGTHELFSSDIPVLQAEQGVAQDE